mgnify:CR=1 FL=1|jgi:flavin-dependent dehydrogenase
MSDLPVVVIGAGPLGLAAAAHLVERGLVPLVLEAGDGPGTAVDQWAHVRTFSPWPELIDPAAARLLAPTGWTPSEAGYPTGREWIDDYLAPLAAVLGSRVRYRTRVAAVSRLGRDRLVSAGRSDAPFVVHVTQPDGTEARVHARPGSTAPGRGASPIRPAPTEFRLSGNGWPQIPGCCPLCRPRRQRPRMRRVSTSW